MCLPFPAISLNNNRSIIIWHYYPTAYELICILYNYGTYQSIFCKAYPTLSHREPGHYPWGRRAQGRGHTGRGANASHTFRYYRDVSQPKTCVSELVKNTGGLPQSTRRTYKPCAHRMEAGTESHLINLINFALFVFTFALVLQCLYILKCIVWCLFKLVSLQNDVEMDFVRQWFELDLIMYVYNA